MQRSFMLQVNPEKELHAVSDMLFGIFLEDINFTCDGGLNANLVNNYSFDGIYYTANPKARERFSNENREMVDRLRYWQVSDGKMASCHDDPLAENSWFARVSSEGTCRLENPGYNGGKAHAGKPAMAISATGEYEFACQARSQGFTGSVTVKVVGESGKVLTTEAFFTPTDGWQQQVLMLKGLETGYGKLVIQLEGQGTLDLDAVSLMSADTWSKGDPRWSQGRLRCDMVETLRNLKPKFMRFPGGCIVEGCQPGNEYNWQDTVGPLVNRKSNFNLWGEAVPDGGYNQSYQVGFYEYFLLCEDLGIEPLPMVSAGINCQVRTHGKLDMDSLQFQQEVVQRALDLVDYANGDPGTSLWAKLRAEAGHPKPFNLKYIGIGNENFGDDYLEKFALVKKAIDEKFEGITCVLSCGLMPQGKNFKKTWQKARTELSNVRVDEHKYMFPRWFFKNAARYDNYSRGDAKVFMGEYAANFMVFGLKPNSYETALAEAAFMTGLERNSDVVAMSSYAPLFSLAEGQQWQHNLINFNPAHMLLTANYFVQKMFSTTVGDQVVEVSGAQPKGVYTSATSTRERLVIKLVYAGKKALSVHLSLVGIPDGSVQVEYLQSDDLEAANGLTFDGVPHYSVQPQIMEVPVKDGRLELELKPYSVYVLQAWRGKR
jgi:alpha-N-arabinofuranosidase